MKEEVVDIVRVLTPQTDHQTAGKYWLWRIQRRGNHEIASAEAISCRPRNDVGDPPSTALGPPWAQPFLYVH